jgi:hypothetical protein
VKLMHQVCQLIQVNHEFCAKFFVFEKIYAKRFCFRDGFREKFLISLKVFVFAKILVFAHVFENILCSQSLPPKTNLFHLIFR